MALVDRRHAHVHQDKRFWDYSALFRGGSNRYRLSCNVVFSAFAQWAGNGALTYYLPAVLTTIGITDDVQQANVNLGYACFQFFFALCGAALVERVGRRKLMLFSMGACTGTWVVMSASAGTYAKSDSTNNSAANAMLAFIFVFGMVFSIGITPLQALYPVEVLSFEQRAKGMAFSSLCINAASLLNNYAWPIALARIGWHTYLIFMVWCAIQTTVFCFLMPETRRRTLEELDKIFSAPNPVKASLVPHKIAVDSHGTILVSEDA
jgi:MFS family permease